MYGEVRNAKTLASAIEEARAAEPVNTTGRLREIATRVAIGERNRYLSQVFQAIRLEVNDEMGALKALLQSSVQLLKPGGRLVIISYHSLEDRMVKNFMKTGSTEGESEEDLMGRKERYFQILTKKPLEPDEAEINLNPRARSARMRVAERVN
jgi:16S rRNA (cytosine1402-N4)-methyltransferase